jgi:hypothetical protein
LGAEDRVCEAEVDAEDRVQEVEVDAEPFPYGVADMDAATEFSAASWYLWYPVAATLVVMSKAVVLISSHGTNPSLKRRWTELRKMRR